jgi:hypothetical protein
LESIAKDLIEIVKRLGLESDRESRIFERVQKAVLNELKSFRKPI